MTVLITGGCGYIGSHAAVAMINAGHDVILADDFRNSLHSIPMRIGKITGTLPAFYEIDVCDALSLDKIFRENEINCVLHCAGSKTKSAPCETVLPSYRNNIDSALTSLEAAAKYSCSGFVYLSSASVYGAGARLPYTELEPVTDVDNPFGRAAIAVERLIEDAVRSCGISAVILRCFNVVGAHPSGLIGEFPRIMPDNIMPQLTRVAVRELSTFRIYGDDYPTADGTGVRDYVHVVDVARGCLNAAEYTMAHEGCMTVNLGSGKGTSVLELIECFEETTGVSVPRVIAPKREGDAAEVFSEPVRSFGVLDWQPELTLRDMCRDAWRWQCHLTAMNKERMELEVI